MKLRRIEVEDFRSFVGQTTVAPLRDGLTVVAGDLGQVFSVAKRRIERAINDAYESGK